MQVHGGAVTAIILCDSLSGSRHSTRCAVEMYALELNIYSSHTICFLPIFFSFILSLSLVSFPCDRYVFFQQTVIQSNVLLFSHSADTNFSSSFSVLLNFPSYFPILFCVTSVWLCMCVCVCVWAHLIQQLKKLSNESCTWYTSYTTVAVDCGYSQIKGLSEGKI